MSERKPLSWYWRLWCRMAHLRYHYVTLTDPNDHIDWQCDCCGHTWTEDD